VTSAALLAPLDAGAQQTLYANNLSYNCAIYNMDIYSGRAYHSVSIIGNVALGGPNSGTVADTKYPTLTIQGQDLYYGDEIAVGEATAGAASALTDSSQSWSTDSLVGHLIRISGDPGETHTWREIVSNTATTLTISGTWPEPIGAGSSYVIKDLSEHEVYIADNTAIEYNPPIFTEYAQDGLAQIHDWDHVNDRPNFESAFKATSPPPGTIPAGWAALDDDEVIDYVVANAGAYPSNRDPETQRVIDDILSRTSTEGLRTTVTDDDFPQIEIAGPITLELPDELWSDNDCDGYLNMEEWLHGT